MSSRLGLAVLSAALLCSCSRETPTDIVAGPYLVHVGPRSATIVWLTSAPADGTVECWRGEALPVRSLDALTTTHEVRLTDLRPDAEYSYRVASGPARSPVLRFHTAPALRRKFTFAVCGDTTGNAEQQAQLAAALGRHDPAFIVHTGGLAPRGAALESGFLAAARGLLAARPIIPARGPAAREAAAFRRCFPTASGATWRSFRYLNVEIFALDLSGGITPGDEQHRWLERALGRSDAQWKLIACWPSLYPAAAAATETGPRHALCPLLIRAKADATFSSAQRLYSRTHPIGSGEKPNQNALVHFTTGATAHKAPGLKPEPWLARTQATPHFLLVEADEDLLVVKAIGLDGAIIEAAELFKAGSIRDRENALPAEALEGLLAFLPADGFPAAQDGTPLSVAVANPYDSPIDGLLRWHTPAGWTLDPPTLKLLVPPLSHALYTFTVAARPSKIGDAPSPTFLTADLRLEAGTSPFRLPDSPR